MRRYRCLTTKCFDSRRARFMAPMGYDIKVGYGVGATLELTKEVLPVSVIALSARPARGLMLAFGAAWPWL